MLCLGKKPAQIIDDLKRDMIGEWQISPTLLCVPPSKLREKVGCRCDGLRQRFIVIIWDLVSYDLRICRALFVEIHALFPEILRFGFLALFMRHTVHAYIAYISTFPLKSLCIIHHQPWVGGKKFRHAPNHY